VRLVLGLVPVLLLAAETGCESVCNLAGCSGGFIVRIIGSDAQMGLPSGPLALRAVVEDGAFETACTVAPAGEVSCEHGDWTIIPSVTIAGLVVGSNDTEAGNEVQLHFVVKKDAKNGEHMLGPEHVSLTISLEDVVIFDGSWEPMYERIRDFNGAGCGDCDRAVAETVTLPSDL
jgi:hypothetical protein